VAAQVAVVADADPGAGLGHLSRAGAVAVALGRKGAETNCYASGAEAPFERDGVPWKPLRGDLPFVDGGVLVVDSYRITREKLEATARECKLVVMLDQGTPPDGAALVVAVASANTGSAPHRLAGPAYAALRPDFWDLPERRLGERAERVLVTTGSGQFDPLGCELAEALAVALPASRVTLVRGPQAAGPAPTGVDELVAPESLAEPLLQSDLAVTAGGQTMLEAAAAGTPCVALPLVENQRRQVATLSELGAVRAVDPVTVTDATAAARGLVEDFSARRRLSSAAQKAVDGGGALRVASEIAKLAEQKQ
jgi:spore coat polysaccharide biosynthesis predicted glycosyltransferase SpsG